MSNYPAVAYRQLFPLGRKEVLPPFDPSENGDHYRPEPNFFEWWYFDVAFDDGSYLVAILHSSLYNAADHKPTVDLRYYPVEGPPIVAIARFDRSAYCAAPDHCRVVVGDCLAIDKGDHYRLNLHHELLEVELTLWSELPGCRVGTGQIFADPTSGHHVDWIVPLPRAHVEGTLTVTGEQRPVTGVGYHDHNWGNLYLPAAFSGWVWGRVLASEWTLIFGDVVGRGTPPPHVTPFILARGGKILLTTDHIYVHGEEPVQESCTGVDYFRRLHLTTVEEPMLSLTLTARQAMEALDFAAPRLPLGRHRHLRGASELAFYLVQRMPIVGRLATWLLGKGSYLRWEADYRLDLPDYAAVETGQSLYEVMSLI